MGETDFTPATGTPGTSTAGPDGGHDEGSRVASATDPALAPAAESSPELAVQLEPVQLEPVQLEPAQLEPAQLEPVQLEPAQLAAAYRLVAELLLYPEERDAATVDVNRRALDGAPGVAEAIDGFLASPRAHDLDEYLMLLELAPTCPLYLGTYMFEEPSSCRGAGLSDRNAYMLELKAIYRHFGFEPASNEMADFLPLVAEFLALSLDREALDGIGLRRRLLELHVAPGLKALREKLETYESPYATLIACMMQLVERDEAACLDAAWEDASAGLQMPMLKPFASTTAGAVEAARAGHVGAAGDAPTASGVSRAAGNSGSAEGKEAAP